MPLHQENTELAAQLNWYLDMDFLAAVNQGSCYGEGPHRQQAMHAISLNGADGLPHEIRKAAIICHDVFMQELRSGEGFKTALRKARTTSPGSAAFLLLMEHSKQVVALQKGEAQ